MVSYIFLCVCFLKIVSTDFYAGVFNKNDFLVAQDTLYKERVPYRTVQSMYGRYFKCPITYYRVMDRLGFGRGPRVLVTRGGLRHRFLTLRITSQYNLPTSVTILVGCENKKVTTKRPTTVSPGGSTTVSPGGSTSVSPGGSTSVSPGGSTSVSPGGSTSVAPGGSTSVAPGGSTSVSPSNGTSNPSNETVSAPAVSNATTTLSNGTADQAVTEPTTPAPIPAP